MSSLLRDPPLEALLDRLHAQSEGRGGAMADYFGKRAAEGSIDSNAFDDEADRFLSDKLVALDRDKARFCYQLCRALRATRVVEAGTSFGVSTLYLAAAVRDNAGGGRVIGTENEPAKAASARANFAAAGLSGFIELREGDLRETLKDIGGAIDFALIDIWVPMARPALELIAPSLRVGAIVVCDNTAQFREPYRDYFAFIDDPTHRLRTMTLPFEGGLELTVKCG